MAQFTWTADIPAGVLKNHALSKQLRKAAIADAVFYDFTRKEPGYGKGKGESITITKFKNMAVPTSAVIGETDKVPIDTFSMAKTDITVQQLARGLEYSDLAQQLSFFDLESPLQRALKDQLSLVIDNLAAAAFKTAYVCAIPTSLTDITWDLDGAPSTSATQNLTVAHCGVIRDYMRGILHVPFWEKGRYIGIASVKALRGIKNDPEFSTWMQYLQKGDTLYNSEVGSVEQIRFVECNNISALSNGVGAGTVLGEAVIFGQDAVALAEAQTPELRAAIPGNFGLWKAVAWYGVLAFGLIWNATATPGEARVVRVCSL